MGVERRAPPNPLRVSSETADGRGSILTDNNCSGADPRATLQQNFVFLFFISFAFIFFKLLHCLLFVWRTPAHFS